jgi:CHAT domain-containing protein/tetratricopeptide (TPR) repeat protein
MALDNARSRGDLLHQATLLNQLGSMQTWDFGDPARGRRLLTESLELRRRVGDPRGEAYNLQSLANLDADEGRFDEAIAGFDRAAAIFDTIGDRDGQGSVRMWASRAEIGRGRLVKAAALAEDALNRYRTQKNRAFEGLARLALADVRFRSGAYDRARAEFDAARAIFETLRSPASEASALVGLARLAQQAGRLPEAVELSGRALELLEAVHDTVQRDDLRAGVVASRQAVVEAHVNALLALDRRQPGGAFAARAFQANDRWRARSLRDTLLRVGLDLRLQADPELRLRETRLQAAINRAAARLDRAEPGDSATAQRQREVDDLVEQLRETRSVLRQSSPEYAALEDPGPLDADRFRQDHLEPGTLLLEYALGRDRSWVWAVSRERLTAHALPAGPVIEAAARRAHELMVKSGQRAVRTQARRAAEDLSRLILQPVAHRLHARRLVVVADGALHYIPFAALPKPTVGAATSPGAPLIASAEVVSLPSASVLPLLRAPRATTAASRAVAVLADPVLSVDDPRVRRASSAAAAPAPSASPAAGENEDVVTRAAQAAGLTRFERLPFSRLEAEAIMVAAGPGTFRALDFEANRATALATDFSRYQVLHLATHALLNGKRPELSGIVLSTVDASGAPQDGLLRLHEIYGRRFGSRLVVLSGCQTALGQEIGREGLIGLTRGFMHAGASQVIASVWSVRDRATAELMRRFYDGLLRRKLPASAALRFAQRSMLDDPRWTAPVHWAGFVLQGDWRH